MLNLNKALWTIGMIIMWGVFFIKSIHSLWVYSNLTVPHQLVDLVRQAHLEQEFHTIWDIEVSDAMRIALCTPLTQQQLQMLRQSKDDIASRSIDGYVISHKLRHRELIAVVSVSIDITSKSGNWNYRYSGMKLRITVSRIGKPMINSKWAVTSVTML